MVRVCVAWLRIVPDLSWCVEKQATENESRSASLQGGHTSAFQPSSSSSVHPPTPPVARSTSDAILPTRDQQEILLLVDHQTWEVTQIWD